MAVKYLLVCTQPLVNGASMVGNAACPTGWQSVSWFHLLMQPNGYYLPVCDSTFTPGIGVTAGCPGNVRGITVVEAMLNHSDFDAAALGSIIAASFSVLATAWIIRTVKRVINS